MGSALMSDVSGSEYNINKLATHFSKFGALV